MYLKKLNRILESMTMKGIFYKLLKIQHIYIEDSNLRLAFKPTERQYARLEFTGLYKVWLEKKVYLFGFIPYWLTVYNKTQDIRKESFYWFSDRKKVLEKVYEEYKTQQSERRNGDKEPYKELNKKPIKNYIKINIEKEDVVT
jgi:hypothetical protein